MGGAGSPSFPAPDDAPCCLDPDDVPEAGGPEALEEEELGLLVGELGDVRARGGEAAAEAVRAPGVEGALGVEDDAEARAAGGEEAADVLPAARVAEAEEVVRRVRGVVRRLRVDVGLRAGGFARESTAARRRNGERTRRRQVRKASPTPWSRSQARKNARRRRTLPRRPSPALRTASKARFGAPSVARRRRRRWESLWRLAWTRSVRSAWPRLARVARRFRETKPSAKRRFASARRLRTRASRAR